MHPPTVLQSGFALLLLTACSIGSAQGKLEYRSPSDVDLPAIDQRKVLGTWLNKPPPDSCTRSFEEVRNKVYMVFRCSDGSGGKTGVLVNRVSPSKFVSTTRPSDYYVITSNGQLSVRDRDGEVELEPKHIELRPNASGKPTPTLIAEGGRTKGLSCYNVGYRYGHTATSSMKGKLSDPSWDFAIPSRCKNDAETERGIQAGVRAVS